MGRFNNKGSLERDDLQPWDHLEVPDIPRPDGVAVVKRRHSDQQIGGRDDESGLLHLGVDFCRQDSHLTGEGFYRKDGKHLVEIAPSLERGLWSVGPVPACSNSITVMEERMKWVSE